VRRLGDLAVGNLLEGVKPVAVGVEGVHEMHFGGCYELAVVLLFAGAG
jgi:hypothetical protein